MFGQRSIVAEELVRCIGEGRAPSVQELGRLANRISSEIGGGQSALTWNSGAETKASRWSYRIALAALVGDCAIFSDRVDANRGDGEARPQ